MSRVLTVSLSDEAFAALERRATAAGLSPAELLAAAAEGDVPRPAPDDAARRRLARFVGCIRLDRPTGADNEGIDADLAREYGGG